MTEKAIEEHKHDVGNAGRRPRPQDESILPEPPRFQEVSYGTQGIGGADEPRQSGAVKPCPKSKKAAVEAKALAAFQGKESHGKKKEVREQRGKTVDAIRRDVTGAGDLLDIAEAVKMKGRKAKKVQR